VSISVGRLEHVHVYVLTYCSLLLSTILCFFCGIMIKPERILFYRDGVSEDQFVQVHRDEVTVIRSGCKKLHVTFVPEITSVVVLKCHFARLFPMQKDQADRSGICPPGTVVNTGIICHKATTRSP
jgi:eukaryotic translation initiation factor 2C